MNETTAVTELSPSAQAVLDAAHEAWVTKDDPRNIAAAVLRALVKTCSFEHFNNFNTVLIFAEDVLSIANKLEAV